jgi:ketosteroid isomerase-like protein
MFKIKSLIFIHCIFLSSTATAQVPTKNQLEVQQTIINIFEALSNRDAIGLRNACTPDVRFYEYGESWTIDTLINRAITKNITADFKRINTFEFINTTLKGEVAWATYNLTSTITSNGNERVVNWNETVILLRERKQWKLTVLQSTRVGK